jgi:hypothetical protein
MYGVPLLLVNQLLNQTTVGHEDANRIKVRANNRRLPSVLNFSLENHCFLYLEIIGHVLFIS